MLPLFSLKRCKSSRAGFKGCNLIRTLIELLRKRLVQNILALYSVQAANYLLPLVTIPFLTRVLGVESWGWFAFFQSFGLYANTLVEYSFSMAATRDVSVNRGNPKALGELLAGVLGAKFLLGLCIFLICLILLPLAPQFREHALLYWSGIVWSVTLGFNYYWYFQGLEKNQISASLDLTAKGLATVAIFLLIRRPADTWMIFALYSLGNVASFLAATGLAYRQVPFSKPTWKLAASALKNGRSLFGARMWVNLYTTGNSFILGLFAGPVQVGYFAGAEKIGRAVAGLCNPVTQAIFPRLSLIAAQDRQAAISLARKSLAFLFIFGLVLSLVLFWAAPWLTKVILGEEYGAAAPVLRILALMVIFIAITNVLGAQWMLALRMDRSFKVIVASAGILNVLLAALLTPRQGAQGMAWAVVTAEFVVMMLINIALLKKGIHPLESSGGKNNREQR